jgi:pimeloyl-CoA synthetase
MRFPKRRENPNQLPFIDQLPRRKFHLKHLNQRKIICSVENPTQEALSGKKVRVDLGEKKAIREMTALRETIILEERTGERMDSEETTGSKEKKASTETKASTEMKASKEKKGLTLRLEAFNSRLNNLGLKEMEI